MIRLLETLKTLTMSRNCLFPILTSTRKRWKKSANSRHSHIEGRPVAAFYVLADRISFYTSPRTYQTLYKSAHQQLDSHIDRTLHSAYAANMPRSRNNNPNALLFFRLGDFYELFFEDAVVAARSCRSR